MAYEKHVWQTNEIITADKLNHIEDGIGGGVRYVPVTESNGVMILDISRSELNTELFTNHALIWTYFSLNTDFSELWVLVYYDPSNIILYNLYDNSPRSFSYNSEFDRFEWGTEDETGEK